MKCLSIFLCSLFIFLCTLPYSVRAEEFEWAQRAREKGPSPASKAAYEKAVAKQEAKKAQRAQEALEQQESFKQFEEEQAALATQREAEEEVLEKECGKDYKHLRVGLKLSRVQKCVAEFFLHGQVKWKGNTVDYYTRGDTFLYVKKGKVVAWGE